MSQFPTTTVQDPAVPMIALPARFRSRRQVTNVRPEAIPESNCVEILDVAGPGAVRHIWLLHGTGRRLEITVDGAPEPQVDVPFDPFFGVMHDLKPYPVDCAAYTVLPNFHTPGVPGTPGYNLFLPIPFSRSCRIRLHLPPGLEQRAVSTMVDWQEYDAGTELTPFRLGAEHHRYLPAPPRNRAYRIADVTGSGFIAGVVLGARQRNHTDMVYHTGGMSILIDGEDDPHVIRGINMEDDFGYSWGFHERQSRWIGSPYHRRRGRNDQDGVIYRFFGPDSDRLPFLDLAALRVARRRYRDGRVLLPGCRFGSWRGAGADPRALAGDRFLRRGRRLAAVLRRRRARDDSRRPLARPLRGAAGVHPGAARQPRLDRLSVFRDRSGARRQ